MSWGTRTVSYPVLTTRGEPVETNAELFTPQGSPPPGGWPVVVYGHGTSGLGPEAFTPPRARPVQEATYLNGLVAQGWAVVAPTYLLVGEPPVHTYLDGPDEATAMVLALRAARCMEPRLGRRWVAHGGSQGGHAALWTAKLAPALAPNLTLAGTVALCPASHIETALRLVDPRLPGRWGQGLVSTALMICAGARAALPGLDVDSCLTPRGRALVREIGPLDVAAIDALVGGAHVQDVFARSPMKGALGHYLRPRLKVPTRLPGEVRVIHGRHDDTVPISLSRLLVGRMRLTGTHATLTTVDSGHLDIIEEGSAAARAAIADLLQTAFAEGAAR